MKASTVQIRAPHLLLATGHDLCLHGVRECEVAPSTLSRELFATPASSTVPRDSVTVQTEGLHVGLRSTPGACSNEHTGGVIRRDLGDPPSRTQ